MSVPVLLTGLEATSTPPLTTDHPPHSTTSPEEEDAENQYVPKTDFPSQNGYMRKLSQVPMFDEKSMCDMYFRPFAVQVNMDMDMEPNEMMAVTGTSAALGEWQPERAVPLRPCGHMQWVGNVPLQSNKCNDIHYRYFTYVLDAHGSRQIRRWESYLSPRPLTPFVNVHNRHVDRFGEIENGVVELHRGWLTNETIVQLKFTHKDMFHVQPLEKFDPKHLIIKLEPLREVCTGSALSEEDRLSIEVMKLKYGGSQLRPQQAAGIEYKSGDVVIFHLTVPRPMKFVFALVFLTPDQKPIGRALIKSEELHGSEGELVLNIMAPEEGDVKFLAQLTLPYLVVQPMEQAKFDFHTSYAKYWPKSWPNLDVAHRGMGRSYIPKNAPEQLENTVASFLEAYNFKTDMVELDVHLTADGVPIIWHDFAVKTASDDTLVVTPDDLKVVLIKDINYEQLKQLRVFAVIDNNVIEYPSHNCEHRLKHRVFPMLVDVLKALPYSLGIDVEIKWPQRTEDGSREAEQTIDKNFYVDRILQTVLKYGCGRPLVFSSFDADICTMLRFKQNMLPVMFLTIGATKKWKPFMDLRTRSFEQAVNFAQALELVGTAPHAEDFVGRDGARLMMLAHKLNQIIVVWGEDCNSQQRVQYFSGLGAAAICYDRTDLNLPSDKQSSFFDTIASKRLFDAQKRNFFRQ